MERDAHRQTKIDAGVRKWDEVLEYLQGGGDKTYGYLQLAQSDLGVVAAEIICPYCRKQMVTELKLLGIALNFAKIATEWGVSTGFRKKLGLMGRAIPLIATLTYLEVTKIL